MKYILLLLIFAIPSLAKSEGILVEAIGGKDVSIAHGGKIHPLQVNEGVVNGDKIETGKSTAIDLRLQDQSLVRVGVHSSVELKDGFLKLDSGTVRVLVPEQTEKSKTASIRFRLSTAEGTVGVRGTEFITDRKDNSTTVHTLRGEVLFGPSSDFSDLSKFVVVMKGYESTLKVGEHKAATPKQFSIDSYLPMAKSQNFSSLASREAGMQKARNTSKQADLAVSPSETNSSTSVKTNSPKANVAESPLSSNPNDLLISAASRGDTDQMSAALQSGADPKTAVIPETGDSILHIAAVNEQLNAVQFILDKVHVPVDFPNKKGQSALMEASSEANGQDVVLLLLQNGASLKLTDRAGHTAIDYARGNPNTKAILPLLQSFSK